MIIDPFTLKIKRPAGKQETNTFEENGISLTVTLSERRDATRQILSEEKAELYQARYVTGVWVRDETGQKNLEVSTLAPVDGMIPAASNSLCTIVARLEMMQVTEGTENPLTFEQWAAYAMLMPNSFLDIALWSQKLQYAAELSAKDDEKNVSGEAAAL